MPFWVPIIDKPFKWGGLNQIGRTLFLGVKIVSTESEVYLFWFAPYPDSVIKGGMTDQILSVSYIKGLQQAVLRIRITLMKIRIRILLVTFIRIWILLVTLIRIWILLVTLIRIWILLVTLIRTLPFTLMRILIRILASKQWLNFKNALIGSYSIHFGLSSADPAYYFDADPDPTCQFNADPCGYGSTTLAA
jgi:hypothetical protein